MTEMTPADWTIFLTEPYVDEPFPRPRIVCPLPYCEQDQPPPSPAEMERRLIRDRALQRWHTHQIAMPFQRWLTQRSIPA
jgi:hypothetical protein